MDRRNDSIGIYIHIPFCKSKCYYCDFNSYAGRENLAGSYFDALYKEIMLRSRRLGGRQVCSVFIGGGTPSLVDPGYITKLIDVCREHFHVVDDAEISMESNPGTLTYDRLRAYRDAGVNRLSIGLQAWQDRILKSIGRIHNRQQFVDNLKAAEECGFDNINVDLIFGLPGQTLGDWMETLEAVTGFGPAKHVSGQSEHRPGPVKHISCYSLAIEEGTVFGDRLDARLLEPADDGLDREMYHRAVDMLAEKGFRWYEISNFAVPGYECRHNLLYWKTREYAGFGAGAHSYLDAVRFNNVYGIEEYIRAVDNAYNRNKYNRYACGRCEYNRNECNRYTCSSYVYDGNGFVGTEGDADPAIPGRNANRDSGEDMAYCKDNADACMETAAGEAEDHASVAVGPGRMKKGDSAAYSSGANSCPDAAGSGFLKDMDGLHENFDVIDKEGAMSEFMILGLRLTEGVSSAEFEERFGERLEDKYGGKLDMLAAKGLIEAENMLAGTVGCGADRRSSEIPSGESCNADESCKEAGSCKPDRSYKLTRLGFDLANTVFVEFI